MSEWVDRFHSHYVRSEPDKCWEWRSARSQNGYGRFMLSGKARIASRISYEVHCGPIPAGLCVMHICDNPACVNPHHLRLGTHSDNMLDRNVKGRARGGSLRGERHWNSKISQEQADKIRILARQGRVPQRSIASMFGISQSQVSEIKNENTW